MIGHCESRPPTPVPQSRPRLLFTTLFFRRVSENLQMELSWTALALICLAGATAWFWQDSLAARESANAAAMEACQRLGLQFLDGTVAFARLALGREAGRVRLRRTYVFDYTANSIERRQGFVVLSGARVESVGYAAEPRERTGVAPPQIPATLQTGQPAESKVLDLEDWRARNRAAGEHAPRREDHEA